MADGSITARALNVGSLHAVSGDFGDASFTGKMYLGPNQNLVIDGTTGQLIGYRDDP